MPDRALTFGRYRLEPRSGLTSGTRQIKLTPKALSLLSVSRTPAHLKLDTYRPHVGTTFRVRQNGARPLDLRLVRITELGPGRFGLLFKGPRHRDFEQDARLTVTHPVVGRFPLSIGAVGASKRGQHYEAIVNRPGA